MNLGVVNWMHLRGGPQVRSPLLQPGLSGSTVDLPGKHLLNWQLMGAGIQHTMGGATPRKVDLDSTQELTEQASKQPSYMVPASVPPWLSSMMD